MTENGDRQDILPEPAAKKPLVQSAKEFVNGVLSPLRTRDVGQMVEEFTAEMTLVAEGLSDDMAALDKRNEDLTAAQLQQSQALDAAASERADMKKELRELGQRLDRLEKQLQESKPKKAERLGGIMKQAVWLAAIVCGTWLLVSIIGLFK